MTIPQSDSNPAREAAVCDPSAWRLSSRPVWLLLALVFALGVALGFRMIHSPDIGFHLASGEWILKHGKVPTHDILSFTCTDHAYIDLQWLFQILLVGAHKLGGVTLVLLGKIALTLCFWSLLLYRTWLRVGRIPLSAVLLLIPVALGDLWEERPHLLSWNFGSLILLALEQHARGNRKWLPVLPVVMLLWVNSHSLFVLGLVCIGTYAGWELLMRRQRDGGLALWSLAAVFVCVANPYFLRGFELPLIQFFEIQGDHPFNWADGGLAEFQSPFSTALLSWEGRLVLFNTFFYWQSYLWPCVAAYAWQFKRLGAVERILFIGFTYILLSAGKNFSYFVMVTFPIAASGLSGLFANGMARLRARLPQDHPMTPDRLRLAAASVTGLCVSILTVAVVSGAYYALEWTTQRFGKGINDQYLPVHPAEFIRTNNIQGNILCCFEAGGYLAWRTGQKVSIYGIGEVIGPDEYVRYLKGLTSSGTAGYIESVNPDVAVCCLDRTWPWIVHLSRSPDWRLVQLTDAFAVFLKKGVAPHVAALPPPVRGKDYPLIPDSEVGPILNRAKALPEMTWSGWWQGASAFPDRELLYAHMHYLIGQPQASFAWTLDGLRKGNLLNLELFLVAGQNFEAMGNAPLALLCYKNYLLHRQDAFVQSRVMAIQGAMR